MLLTHALLTLHNAASHAMPGPAATTTPQPHAPTRPRRHRPAWQVT